MSCRLSWLGFDAIDPVRLARFWSGLLGWDVGETLDEYVELRAPEDSYFGINFLRTNVAKTGPNQMHFHLTSASLDDQHHTVARALALGARHLDVGQLPEEGHVVLGDPEGNEFCVIEPGNAFLADCGFLGEVTCDGSREVGVFWSRVLGWPLVWDQNEETSIRSPTGGPKISWSGSPLTPKREKCRLHFDVAPQVDVDQQVEVERLVALGAARVDIGQGDVPWVVMTDLDGHEFCVLTPR